MVADPLEDDPVAVDPAVAPEGAGADPDEAVGDVVVEAALGVEVLLPGGSVVCVPEPAPLLALGVETLTDGLSPWAVISGVVTLGVLTTGVVTLGTVTLGTVTAGMLTAGSVTAAVRPRPWIGSSPLPRGRDGVGASAPGEVASGRMPAPGEVAGAATAWTGDRGC